MAKDKIIKPKRKNKPGAGRPKKIIDYEMVKELSQHACTIEEIGSYLGCSHDTLSKDPKFKEVYQEGLNKCRRSLRSAQYEAAMDGDRTMLVWLGKCLLGQKEKTETELTLQGGTEPIKIMPIKERIKQYEKIFHEIST